MSSRCYVSLGGGVIECHKFVTIVHMASTTHVSQIRDNCLVSVMHYKDAQDDLQPSPKYVQNLLFNKQTYLINFSIDSNTFFKIFTEVLVNLH